MGKHFVNGQERQPSSGKSITVPLDAGIYFITPIWDLWESDPPLSSPDGSGEDPAVDLAIVQRGRIASIMCPRFERCWDLTVTMEGEHPVPIQPDGAPVKSFAIVSPEYPISLVTLEQSPVADIAPPGKFRFTIESVTVPPQPVGVPLSPSDLENTKLFHRIWVNAVDADVESGVDTTA